MKTMVFWCLAFLLGYGFVRLFYEIGVLNRLAELYRRTRADIDAFSRQRTLADRKQLLQLKQKHTVLFTLERQLQYTGLKRHFPRLTVEWWIACNLAAAAGLFLITLIWGGILGGGMAVALFFAGEGFLLRLLRGIQIRRVNDSLMKLLDFLGNYSVSVSEVTGVFQQVSRYMDEPLRSALDACCYEAQTTGDAGLALLSMAEKIEHPKFKELARNMEVSIRYSADFSALVNGSRRSMREYLRVNLERKGMLKEAAVNMLLLLGMAALVLMTVGSLTETSMTELLLGTFPGRAGCCVLLGIFGLFAGQLHRAQC